jgi:hypothetical protein
MEQRHRGSNPGPANEDRAIDSPEGDLDSLALRPPLLDPVHGGDYHTGSETVAGSVRQAVLSDPDGNRLKLGSRHPPEPFPDPRL